MGRLLGENLGQRQAVEQEDKQQCEHSVLEHRSQAATKLPKIFLTTGKCIEDLIGKPN